MSDEPVTVTSWKRFKHWLAGLFHTKRRQMTEVEFNLYVWARQLHDELQQAKEQNRSLLAEIQMKDTQLAVAKAEIEGMAGIIARHEKHWEAEQAIQSARVALADRIAAEHVSQQNLT